MSLLAISMVEVTGRRVDNARVRQTVQIPTAS